LINASPSAYAGDFAYLTSYAPGRSAKLFQLDTTNEAVLKEIDLPGDESLGDMVIDEKGGCYLSSYRLADRYGRNIFYFDAASGKLDRFVHLDSIFGPHKLALNDKELIVVVEGNDDSRLKSGVLVIDRRSKEITGKIFLREDDPKYIQCNIIDSFYDGHKYLYVTTMDFIEKERPDQYIGEQYGFGNIFVIDIVKKEISKIIDVPRYYDTLSGIVNVGDKIYMAAQAKGMPAPSIQAGPNKELLVFSFNNGTLISTIEISPHPFDLIYDKATNKLYVLHTDDDKPRNIIEIIDVKTDKIIGKMKAPSQITASMVAPNKMYISLGPGFLRKVNTKPRILAINTKTNKVIKEIEGVYQDISINQKY
jgi:DNA-binding beta-propeller fold protein YncE